MDTRIRQLGSAVIRTAVKDAKREPRAYVKDVATLKRLQKRYKGDLYKERVFTDALELLGPGKMAKSPLMVRRRAVRVRLRKGLLGINVVRERRDRVDSAVSFLSGGEMLEHWCECADLHRERVIRRGVELRQSFAVAVAGEVA